MLKKSIAIFISSLCFITSANTTYASSAPDYVDKYLNSLANDSGNLFSDVGTTSTEMLAKISDLTDIQKSSLRNLINSVIDKRKVDLDNGNSYSSMLAINLSDLTDNELQWLLDAIDGNVDINSLDSSSGPVSENSIDVLIQNASDFDKKLLRNAADCAIYNLDHGLKIESFSSYIAQQLSTTSRPRLEHIKEALQVNSEDGKKDVYEITANYTDWFNYFSPADSIEYDPHFTTSVELGGRVLSLDDIQIFIDSETNEIQFIMLPLNVGSGANDTTKQAFNLVALISSVEFGDLPKNDFDREQVKNVSSIISYNLVNCLTDNASEIIADKRKTFYEDDDYVYQIIYLEDSSKFEMVIFETNN